MNPELLRCLEMLGQASRSLLASACRLVELLAGALARALRS